MIESINISVCSNCDHDIYPEDTSCKNCGESVGVKSYDHRNNELSNVLKEALDNIEDSHDHYKKT